MISGSLVGLGFWVRKRLQVGKVFLLAAVLVSLVQVTLKAQPENPFFAQLTPRNGLSQSGVTTMLQDRQGYLWFGSQNGLNRYDGYSFTVFRKEQGNPASLSDNYITGLAEDAQGYLWIATDYGLNRYNPRTEQFAHYLHQEKKPNSLSKSRIMRLVIDRKQNLWIANRSGGVSRIALTKASNLDPKTAEFEHFLPSNNSGLTDSLMVDLFEDREGTIWTVGKNKGIYRYNPTQNTFSPVQGPAELYETGFFYTNFFEDRTSNTLWMGAKTGLYSFNRKTGAFTRHLPDLNDVIYDVEQDRDGTLWLATQHSGLYAWNPRRGISRQYRNGPNDPGSLICLYLDKAGSLWTSVFTVGLLRYDPAVQQFNEYQCANWQTFTANNQAVSTTTEDKAGNLWLAYSYDLKLGKFDRKNCTLQEIRVPIDPANTDPQMGLNWMHLDKKQRLWLATIKHGTYCYDLNTGTFTHLDKYFAEQGLKDFGTSNYVSEDRQGTMWFAITGGGVISFNPETKQAKQYLSQAGPNSLSSNNVLSVYADSHGTVWAGTWGGGLNSINPKTGQVTAYPLAAEENNSFPASSVFAFAEDAQGRFWVGTTSGLAQTDRTISKVRWYTEKEGLNNLMVRGICQDTKGNLWLNTGAGVSKFDAKLQKITNLDINQGREVEAVGLGGVMQARNGELFFSLDQGILGFHPDKIKLNQYKPPVMLSGLQVLNKPVLVGQAEAGEEPLLKTAPAFTKELVLDYWQDVVTFEFAALNFSQPDNNEYAYQLIGFDKDWVYSGTKRSATYTNLDPGTYTFRIKGSNNDGLWNEQGQSVQLTILPPPWLTWWAFLIYGIALSGAVYGLTRYWSARERWSQALRLRQLEAQKLQELDQLKTHFFTNISHEFRTPLTLILGPLQKWLTIPDPEQNRQRDLKLIHRNANRLLQLINQLLDISKLEAGSLQLQAAEQELVRFSKGIVYSFSSLAETRQIKLNFTSTVEELPLYFDQDKLEKVLSNLLSNAFKFTSNGGSVSVYLQKVTAANTAEITISDTGIGIPEDRLPLIFNRFYQVDGSQTRRHEGTGIGLALTRELVLLHHGQITVSSEPGKGTTFKLVLPLGSQHLKPEEITDAPEAGAEITLSPVELLTDLPATLPIALDDEAEPLLLIVEDNADVRTYIRSNFEESYRILEAANGEQGLAMAIEQVPDVIISDLMMPVMDGMELTRRLKTDERTSHIPVILLTAKAAIEDRIEGLETGADDYVTKPFQPQELQVRVRNLIQQRQRLRERYWQTTAAPATERATPISDRFETLKLEPAEVLVTSADKKFLERVIATVEQHMSNEDFDVEQLGEAMALSRVQLYRKIKALTGHTATEFIRSLRLKRAASLLEQGAGNVAEIGYQVGFQSMSYFAKCFREQYGCTPSEYKPARAVLPAGE